MWKHFHRAVHGCKPVTGPGIIPGIRWADGVGETAEFCVAGALVRRAELNALKNRCGELFALLAISLLFPVSSFARNMAYTHGNDYEFTIAGEAFFPVVWDVRSAWLNYFGYARDYIGYDDYSATSYADREISGVLTQALNAGVNTALIRGTVGHDAQYGSFQFPGRADMVRALGMNVMLGGFKDILDDVVHNTKVKGLIETYAATPVPPGYAPIVGIHGFDEPDIKFDSSPEDRVDIVNALTSYHSWSNNLGYPFGSFLAKPAKYVPSLAGPNSGTYPNSTIYQICSHLDFPMLDWYPCRTYDDWANVFVPQADIWGATDLIPTSTASNHYYAYNNRDELWSIDHNETSGSTSFIVYEVTDEEEYGYPGFSQVFSSQPGLSWPFEVASSDYRTADVGDRAAAEHDLNSAVVMYHTGDQIEQAEVVMHYGTSLVTVHPPHLNETASTILFCVGEDNYESSNRVSATPPVNSGVIGSADLRILWCGDGVSGMQLQKRVWILGKNSAGTGLTNVISSPLILPGNFMPTGAIWGYFWSDTFPYRQSGFILYNDLGNYVVVYTKDHDNWEVSSSIESGLFGNGVNPGAVIAYRRADWPVTSYSTAGDFLCAIASNPYPYTGMVLHWCTGLASTMQMTENHDQFYIHEATASDYNHLSFRHVWHGGDVRFFFGGDEASTYYTENFTTFPDGWSEISNASLHGASIWGVVNNPMRVRHTRRAYANALMNDLGQNVMSIRGGEIRTDTYSPAPGDSGYASIDTYFNNMCRAGEDQYGAFDLEFDWGIDETTEDNCLFANVQAFGKYPMSSASFCPPHDTGNWWESDTLLYMTVAPIVHGARGLSFYALDMALMAGPSSSGSMAPYRAANTLLNWGPSRNCAENADMVSRVHDVVKMLTGKKGGPDYLSALVDHSDYTVLDETEAVNVLFTGGGSYIPFPDDDFLNFIALEDDENNILLLVSHDHDDFEGPFIYFPTRYDIDYGTVQCWGGYDPNQAPCTINPVTHDSRGSQNCNNELVYGSVTDDALSLPRLCVDLSCMPAHSVSLLFIPCGSRREEEQCISEPLLLVRRTADGSVSLQLSQAACGFNLEVYDLLGRQISRIRLPEAEAADQNIVLDKTDFSAGLYFAVIRSDSEILQTEKVTII